MSKSTEDPWSSSEPVPTYEESMAFSNHLQDMTSSEKSASTSVPSVIRQERRRRIVNLVTNTIIPCFTLHLSAACNRLAIAIIPSDGLRTGAPTVTQQNIVAPALPNETAASVIALTGDDNRSSFWTQYAVVQDLDVVLRSQLCGSAVPEDVHPGVHDRQSDPSSSLLATPQPQDRPDLPALPPKRSWLKKTFVLPGPDHDPTGETGKWNLGWRETDIAAPTAPDGSWSNGSEGVHSARTRTRRTGSRRLKPDEIDVYTKLQDVSFRTESDMGLLETTTVRCIWVDIEVGI